jgi:uncharacterized protein YecE (DUF72 family)
MKLWFGSSQWGYSNWAGHLYPRGTQAGSYLKHYSRIFNSVELNPTYHDAELDVHAIIRWRNTVPKKFKFSPKFPKVISHEKKLINAEKETETFLKKAGAFGNKLGILFLQLPRYFKNLPVLNNYLKLIPEGFKVSVEVRPEILSDDNLLIQVFDILKENKKGIVIVDSIDGRKYINKIKLTNHSAFIRFISYGLDSDFDRVDTWVEMIKKWDSKKLPEVHFYLHFPDEPNNFRFIDYTIEKFRLLSETLSEDK